MYYLYHYIVLITFALIRIRFFFSGFISILRLSAVYGRTGSTVPVADNILPCVLEVREETEETWIHAVTMDVDPSTLTFKHAPAYCLYLLARYRASTSYRPDVTPMERANRLSLTFAKVATILYTMIQVTTTSRCNLPVGFGNFFKKQSRHTTISSLVFIARRDVLEFSW